MFEKSWKQSFSIYKTSPCLWWRFYCVLFLWRFLEKSQNCIPHGAKLPFFTIKAIFVKNIFFVSIFVTIFVFSSKYSWFLCCLSAFHCGKTRFCGFLYKNHTVMFQKYLKSAKYASFCEGLYKISQIFFILFFDWQKCMFWGYNIHTYIYK